MRRVLRHAPAKINLYLHVTGKREDGYHLLDSLVVFADELSDIVTIEESDTGGFSVSGPFAGALAGEDVSRNLCVRAAKLYCEALGITPNFNLHLEKNLPTGAGIGGGSADAAATIHALEEFFGKPLPDRDRHFLSLGADVPVCYRAKPCRFLGIGDVIRDIQAPPKLHILLVWPDAHTATKDVFAQRTWEYQRPVAFPPVYGTAQQFLYFLGQTKNDLEDSAITITPQIAQVMQSISAQSHCRLARMSGSGSTVFGLFDDAESSAAARDAIALHHPDWWVKTAKIG